MPLHTSAPSTPVTEQYFHFRAPLRMRGATKAEAVREQAPPVFPSPQIASFAESLAPEVLGPLFAVRVMSIAPEPGSERFLLIAAHGRTHYPLILRSLSRK